MKTKKMSPEIGLKWKMIAMQAFLNCREVRDATKHVLPEERSIGERSRLDYASRKKC